VQARRIGANALLKNLPQFFKRIFEPTEKFAPMQYSAYALVRTYACRRRELAPTQVLKKLVFKTANKD
jgi:hypothetical protein